VDTAPLDFLLTFKIGTFYLICMYKIPIFMDFMKKIAEKRKSITIRFLNAHDINKYQY